jgi:ATP-dependent Clp protease ATP-binding subunit ClpA
MVMGDPLDRAAEQADQLGHGWIGPEHFLLSLLNESSVAGEALRAAGIDHASYRRALEEATGYAAMWPAGQPAGDGKVVAVQAQMVLARAEGMAAGLGSRTVTSEQVLLALLWDRTSLVALSLLDRFGLTRQDILRELEARGVGLDVPMPARPAWGAWRRVPSSEFELVAADLRRSDVLFRYSQQDGDVLVSIVEPHTPD